MMAGESATPHFDYAGLENKAKTEGITFTEAQKHLISEAKLSPGNSASEINRMGVAVDMYMISRYQMMIDQLIDSNDKLGKSTESYARALVWATVGLVVATVALGVVELLPHFLGWK